VCSTGSQQSPLDITDAIDVPLSPLMISWVRRPETIENNGHTIQLNFAAGKTLTVGSRSYSLAQFQFHLRVSICCAASNSRWRRGEAQGGILLSYVHVPFDGFCG
jgi:carbonic anhydrase